LRIISGKYRSRIIHPPKGIKARPTTDKAKEGLFNILVNLFDFNTAVVLDLFAGTGSISYEFASRGCPSIHLVEINNRHLAFIEKTIKELGFSQIKPFRTNVLTFLKTCSYKYDIIFADPPFNLKWIDSIPELVLNSGILKSRGMIILEHPRNKNYSHLTEFKEERKYGGVHFSIFE
jgi:16S rRNA (guanine(966)-N(2))-methyltransferase RsmD